MTAFKRSISGMAAAACVIAAFASGSATAAPMVRAKVAMAGKVQSELARVGCYTRAVDGSWGTGSRKALADYYARTGQRGSLEPTARVLNDIAVRNGRVCNAGAVMRAATVTPVRAVTVASNGYVRAGSLADNYASRLPANMMDPSKGPPLIGLN